MGGGEGVGDMKTLTIIGAGSTGASEKQFEDLVGYLKTWLWGTGDGELRMVVRLTNGEEHIDPQTPEGKRAFVQASRAVANGKHHHGLHWTQRPENQEKLARMARKSKRTRKRQAAANA